MSELVVHKGVGVSLTVNAETRSFRGLATTLQNSGIELVSQDDIHLTIVDPRDAVIPIYSERDQVAIEEVRTKVGEYLSKINLLALRCDPEVPILKIYGSQGRKLGIKVLESFELQEIRSEIETIYRHSYVSINRRMPYHPHIVVGRKTGDQKRRGEDQRVKHEIRVPRDIHFSGFLLAEEHKEIEHSTDRATHKNNGRRYHNLPSSLRGVSR